jgi:hypothetical protein
VRAIRVLTVGFAAAAAVFGLAGPALAHVEVSADKTTAGASNVTLTFTGEAENPAAGIRSERVVLPPGIDPASVTLVKAPAGWTFARADDGFTVSGAALKTGTDAVWAVKIAKLPDGQTRLSFKTVETYGNGDVSRWIEIQEAGQPEPDNPAPLVTLKPGRSTAPADVPSSAPDSATPTIVVTSAPAVAGAPTATGPESAAATGDGGSSTWWIWVVLAALLVGALVVALIRRRAAAGRD